MFRGGSPASGIAAFTGGSITGTNVPYTLAQSAIPFISLSSGSVSAAGAISGITALATIPTAAYCYFPANILATSIVAGWYYCTFSSTTAGTAFLNTYTSGMPTIPASPTAVTDGKGAFTGDTTDENGVTITLPAGVLGINGQLEWGISITNTNNANAKTYRGKFGATTVFTPGGGSNAQMAQSYVTGNRGAAGSQVTGAIGGGPINPGAPVVSAIDTTAGVTLVLSIQKATATDNAVIEAWRLLVAYSA